MRVAITAGVLLLLAAADLSAAGRIVEFGLVVCRQQGTGGPTVLLSSVQSSELLVPVAALAPEEDLPPDEGRVCAEVLSDLTREGYDLIASTPLARRAPTAQEGFLERRTVTVEQLQWTLALPESVAILSCDALEDEVASFSDGESPSAFLVPEGASCAVHLAAILAKGGRVISRSAVAPADVAPPSGPVTVYTAYELTRMFDLDAPRLPRIDSGRSRTP